MLQGPNPHIPDVEERDLLMFNQQKGGAAFERFGGQNRAALDRMFGAVAVELDEPVDEDFLGDA